ncbi:MAG: XcyI family restriction endonuclease [Rectinemataceae bacterium]
MRSDAADLQIAFFFRLEEIRALYLQDALFDTDARVDITQIDSELKELTERAVLNKLARFGIRAEVFLPVPTLIKENPRLVGYYRLLYGISQKEFHKTHGWLKRFEENGKNKPFPENEIEEAVNILLPIGEALVRGIDSISKEIAHELQLLTLGPQFRGGRNTDLGKAATAKTFALIKDIVRDSINEETENSITIINSAGRVVLIQFSSDPDIAITERLKSGDRKLVSIEIKGGKDYSNAHNRLGEAEKSHQKARQDGFFEFWTIVRVDIDPEIAKKESPTTSHFFNLDAIEMLSSEEGKLFRDILASILSIKT